MQAWWWRSVAVCASLAAVAGSVAVVATAIDADRSSRAERATLAASSAPAAPERPAPEPVRAPAPQPARAADAATGASVVVPAGWRRVPDQRLVPVPPGRFGLVLAPNDRAVVLVGTLDPQRVGTPVDPGRLDPEARRLVAAFADGANPGAARVASLADGPDTVDGRRAATSLRRTEGGPRPVDGTLVRVTAVEGAPRGVLALAVVRPGPTQAADARAAEAVVRSLDLGAGPGGRPAQAPVARPAPARPVPPAPIAVRPEPRPATPPRPAPRPSGTPRPPGP